MMQNDKIYSEIISSAIRTKTEANLFLNELDVLTRSLFKTDSQNFDNTLKTGVRATTAYAVQELIKDEDRGKCLEILKNKIKGLEYLVITIAFEPTRASIERISNWIRQNIDNNLTLDIRINYTILGGAQIEYKGHFFSSTLKEDLENYFS